LSTIGSGSNFSLGPRFTMITASSLVNPISLALIGWSASRCTVAFSGVTSIW
jgi:hypothetical protein